MARWNENEMETKSFQNKMYIVPPTGLINYMTIIWFSIAGSFLMSWPMQLGHLINSTQLYGWMRAVCSQHRPWSLPRIPFHFLWHLIHFLQAVSWLTLILTGHFDVWRILGLTRFSSFLDKKDQSTDQGKKGNTSNDATGDGTNRSSMRGAGRWRWCRASRSCTRICGVWLGGRRWVGGCGWVGHCVSERYREHWRRRTRLTTGVGEMGNVEKLCKFWGIDLGIWPDSYMLEIPF